VCIILIQFLSLSTHTDLIVGIFAGTPPPPGPPTDRLPTSETSDQRLALQLPSQSLPTTDLILLLTTIIDGPPYHRCRWSCQPP
ncbi:hypothetical protein A2U01_0056762, partial [Trifolium medium]|nr:hypothetical protein [Trifolium medium]